MKVLFLVSGFPPDKIGGTEIATKIYAEALSKKGIEVHIIAPGSDKYYYYLNGSIKKYLLNRFRLHEYMENDYYVHIIDISTINYTFWVLNLVRKINPDIIYAQGLFMGITALIVDKLYGIPYVVHGRGSDVYKDWKNKWVLKYVLNRAMFTLALTETMKVKIKSDYPELNNIEVVGNTIGSDWGILKPHQIDLEREIIKNHFSDGKFTLLFIGNRVEVKGLDVLLESVKEIAHLKDYFKLLVVGSITPISGAPDNVKFIGSVSHDLIPIHLNHSDLLVIPSRSEGFPLTAIEGMFFSKPIITSDIEVFKELFDYDHGTITPLDSKQFASKIVRMMSDNTLLGEMGERNKLRLSKYTIDNLVLDLIKYYSIAIDKHTHIHRSYECTKD